MKQLLPVLLFLLMCSSVHGQREEPDPLVTDRPDQTEAPSTVNPGTLQIESGLLFVTEDDYEETANGRVPVRQETYALPRSLFRLGITQNLELRLRTGMVAERNLLNDNLVNRQWGVGDLWAGFKLQLTDDNSSGPTVGFFSHIILPTGTDGISDQEVGTTSKFAVAHELSDKHEVSYNIGYEYLGNGIGDLSYSLVWEIGLADFLEIYIEPYGSFENFEDWEANTDAGLKYLISNNMQIDYSFGLGINEEMNFHTLGFSVRLPR